MSILVSIPCQSVEQRRSLEQELRADSETGLERVVDDPFLCQVVWWIDDTERTMQWHIDALTRLLATHGLSEYHLQRGYVDSWEQAASRK